jgi:hydrogenase maturation protein HypF
MTEHAVDEIVGIACDGYGYGANGEAWGGEILLCSRDTVGFKRLAHLEPQPLPGGDVATRYPLRVAAGILSKKVNVEGWLLQNSRHLPHGETEAKVMFQQLRRGSGIVETTSCGRVLDAIAAIIGVCYERTYEGEPAMKLESTAIKGEDALKMKPVLNGNVLDTTPMVLAVFENRDQKPHADLAFSAHAYLAKGLAALAVEKAVENGIKNVGFTGGAAYNELLARIIRKAVEKAGLRFLVHETVPAGDGGVAFGQAVVGGFHDS